MKDMKPCNSCRTGVHDKCVRMGCPCCDSGENHSHRSTVTD